MTDAQRANLPVYSTPSTNARVLLYNGPATCTDAAGAQASGVAELELAWFPTPRLRFRFTSDGHSGLWQLLNPGSLLLSDRGATLAAFLTGFSVSTQEVTTGVASGDIGDGPVNSVEAHVVNGPRLVGRSITDGTRHFWLGRSSWASKRWSLVLDQVPEMGDLENSLRSEGGFAITHSATIESNGGIIDIAESGILFAVAQFLTLLRGEFVGLAVPIGRDHSGSITWERWTGPKVEPWTGRKGCVPDHIVDADNKIRQPELATVFEHFSEDWHDPAWSELLRVGVSQYALANSLSNAEAKVVLSQATLELCAWLWLVPARLSRDGFERLTAADRIRLLLSDMNLPFGIPAAMSSLSAFAAVSNSEKQAWEDGPRTLTEVRNLITHPTKKLRPVDIDLTIWGEIGQLATWYVELTLLFLLGYRDLYLNRTGGWTLQPVPWIASPAAASPSPHFPPLPRTEPN